MLKERGFCISFKSTNDNINLWVIIFISILNIVVWV